MFCHCVTEQIRRTKIDSPRMVLIMCTYILDRLIDLINLAQCYGQIQSLTHLIRVLIIPVFIPPKELWEAYSNRTVRPSVRPSGFHVRSISSIIFEVGIPNLVCGYILGWRSVAYHFWVTVTLNLTSDLVFRIIVSGAYLLYYLR